MQKIIREIVATMLLSSLLLTLPLWQLVPSTKAGSREPLYLHSEKSLVPIHMHSNESLVPIHMNSNMTLTPVHMHYTGNPAIDPIYSPLGTPWHELYPEFCVEWTLTSYRDNGDGILSPNDQIDMTDMEGNVTWYHVDRITWTLLLSNPTNPEDIMYVEFKGPPTITDPRPQPICTFWHEVYPDYSSVYHIIDATGPLEYCTYILIENVTAGGGTSEWHVEQVVRDLILREKIMDPRYTWWHEIHPNYCKWWHVTSWEDNGDGMLSPSDQIDMSNGTWDQFWSMGDVNRDGYIDDTDLDRIEAMYGWTGPPGGVPEDINSDGKVDGKDIQIASSNYGKDFWTTFGTTWYHVDRVTLTLNVTLESAPTEWMKIELKTSYFEEMYNALKHPIQTRWHEVYPHYSNVYTLTRWDWWFDDNCNGVLDVCDYIWLVDESTGLELRYHVEDICYDLILNKKIMNPVCTYWHEVYPDYCEEWHLTSWEENIDDPYPGRLSPGDQIDMTNTMTQEKRWYYVDRVTLTLNITIVQSGEPYLFELKGPFEDIYRVKTSPLGSSWHMVWPYYGGEEALYIEAWEDNCNGVLDYCDYILLSGVLCHVEDLAIDIILNEKIIDPVCTYWHELYPDFGNKYHIKEWEDNGDGLLSPCDWVNITLQPQGPTEEYHVENVTLTLNVTIVGQPGVYYYFEYTGPFEKMYWVKTNPISTDWMMVGGEHGLILHLEDWTDNCNGVLDYCDQILLDGTWCHIEEVAIDIVVKQYVHDVAVINVTPLFASVFQGYPNPVTVTVHNQGDFPETFDVDVNYDGNPVTTSPITVSNLLPGEIRNIIFCWVTKNVPLGTYTITAYAHPVPGETDIADNSLTDGTVTILAQPSFYWKEGFCDYAPSGVPDFDQKQWGTYNWTDQFGAWSHCGPVAVANSLWWLDSKFEPAQPPVTPPAISDGFPLITAYLPGIDDHDPANVPPLVEHLAYLMDTQGPAGVGLRTGLAHSGTNVVDMEAGLAHYLSWSGVNPKGDVNGDGVVNQTDVDIVNAALGSMPGAQNWNMAADIWPITLGWPGAADNVVDTQDLNLVIANLGRTGFFYERTVNNPDYYFIEEEVEKSEDVVLLIGYWYWTGSSWYREGGHYLTVAGVNSTELKIAVSDPCLDAFENGLIPEGRMPILHSHMPPEPPYITHNDAAYVSHDIYNVALISQLLPMAPPNPKGTWTLVNYAGWQPTPPYFAVIESAVITSPLGIHDVAVANVTPCKTIIGQGYTGNVTVKVENQGDFTETFNVTLYANTTEIETRQITLLSNTSTILTFTWNTSGFVKGNYTIWAYAWPVQGETEVLDNMFTNGIVYVGIPGDVDANNLVNMLDLYYIALTYGTTPPNPNYNPNHDIDNNNIINMLDLYIAALHYGQTDP